MSSRGGVFYKFSTEENTITTKLPLCWYMLIILDHRHSTFILRKADSPLN